MIKDGSFRSRLEDPRGKRILVVGFARSGRAALDFFRRRGAVVTISDSRPPWTFADEIPELLAAKMGLEFGEHGRETFLRQDAIVVSPGVPWDLAALAAAREQGIPVMAEVEAAACFLEGPLVGVTGSNGKTTTTSLIGRMLEASGFPTIVGGNIGAPLIGMVDEATPETITVAELSSFQLEGIEGLRPRVAVLLNITPNHLDRHPSFDAYKGAKARIFRNQTANDFAVLNADDPTVVGLAELSAAHKIFFSRSQDLPEGLMVSKGQVLYRVGHLERELFSVRDVKLRGEFNLEDVLAASAAACVLGADFDALAQAVRDFRGVEHRLEHVGDVLGVEFYNDSKATSVDATVKALSAFERGVHLILGGKDKGAPYEPLIPLLRERVRDVLVIGGAAERISRELAGAVELVRAGDLRSAVHMAFAAAKPGDVILLSPACSSFDQFHDFEERGRVFKELVEELARQVESARGPGVRFRLEAPPNLPPVATEPELPAAAEPEIAAAPPKVFEPQLPLIPETTIPETTIAETRAAAADSQPSDEQAHAEAGWSTAARPADTGRALGAEPMREHFASGAPERVYIYEFDAEELTPLDIETEINFEESASSLAATEGSDTAIELNDEPLLFEVPAVTSAVAAAQAQGQADAADRARPAGRGRTKRATAEQPLPGGKPEGKLPGM